MDTPDENLIGTKSEVSASLSSTAGYGNVGWSQEEERALVRKFDWRILPGLSVLYFLCFLDRTYFLPQQNVSNLKGISGMPGAFICAVSNNLGSRDWKQTWE
jgi:hypothetical protein